MEEVKTAQYKFEESKEICQEEMTKLMGNEVERIHQLSQLVCGMLEHHKKSADTLERLLLLLNRRVHEASKRSGNAEKTEKPATTENTQSKSEVSAKGTNSLANDSESSQNQKNEATGNKPSCRARCEYKAQKEEEISFSEGQVIMLSGKIDNEWFEGTLDGKFGKFPAKHVEILVDIP